MATVEFANKNYQRALAKIEKQRGTIQRHYKILENKIKALEKLGVPREQIGKLTREQIRSNNDLYNADYEYRVKIDDIANAESKMDELQLNALKWESELKKALDKQNEVQNKVPEVIKVYMDEWAKRNKVFYRKLYVEFVLTKDVLIRDKKIAVEECILKNECYSKYLDSNGNVRRMNMYNINPKEPLNKYLKDRNLDSDSIKRKISSYGSLVAKMEEYGIEADRNNFLDKTIDKEKEAKMLDLVHRVIDITGRITDARGLNIGAKGDLEGYIIGERSKCTVNTIGAGGYNIQCFHFRTLIHEVK